MAITKGTIKKVQIADDGWSAYVTLEGMGRHGTVLDYDLNADAIPRLTFEVTSKGYSSTGRAIEVTRDIYASKVVRLPYPDDKKLDHKIVGDDLIVRVALSDYVFAGEPIQARAAKGWAIAEFDSGNVSSRASAVIAESNGSDLTYATVKPVAKFATPDHTIVKDQIHVEVVAANAFAKGGQEVAAVKLTVTDTTGKKVTKIVTKDTVSGWGADDAKPVTAFATDISTATLKDGKVTVHAEVMPYVGTSTHSAVSSKAASNPALFADQTFIVDKNSDFGKSFAYVDASASGRSMAHRDAAKAAASPFKTIADAMKALQIYNDTTFDRENLDNSVIRLKAGIHKWIGGELDPGAVQTDHAWVTITRDPKASKSAVKLVGTTNDTGNLARADLIKITGVTIDRSATSTATHPIIVGEKGDHLWIHDVRFIGGNTASPSFFVEDVWVTQSSFANTGRALSSYGPTLNVFKIRGVTADASSNSPINSQLLIGSDLKNLYLQSPLGSGNPGPSGNFVGYNLIESTSHATLVNIGGDRPTSGSALLNNKIVVGGSIQPGVSLSGDSHFNTIKNLIFHHNSVSGARTNIGYNDEANRNYLKTAFSLKWNSFDQINTKHDVFSQDGDNTGGWSVYYGTGFANNTAKQPPASPDFHFAFDGQRSVVPGQITSSFQAAALLSGATSNQNVYLGTGGANKYLAPNATPALILGLGGNDVLYGNAGRDTLRGGSGNDTLYGQLGGDIISGNSGTDTASYAGSTGVKINLATGSANGGHATGDKLYSIENIVGSIYADAISGNDARNALSGGGAADTLRGGNGNDKLEGGLGADVLSGDQDADQFVYRSRVDGSDRITDFGSADTLVFRSQEFGVLSKGRLTDKNFVAHASSNAVTATDFFIFNESTNAIWFDSNGSSPGGERVLIATLANGYALQAGDILIV